MENNQVICNKTGALKCTVCGETEPMVAMPILITEFIEFLRGFTKKHDDKGCNSDKIKLTK